MDASLCLDEHEPDLRTRHAAALLLRRALSDAFSVGASYRFIFDDWGLTSHTASLELGLLVGESHMFSLRYRFYTQTGVDFYAARYISPLPAGAYTTRDREQSPMHDQRIALDWQHKAQLSEGLALSVTAAVAGSHFEYADFVGLTSVYALEFTLALGFLR
jgi:hypothetical protein